MSARWSRITLAAVDRSRMKWSQGTLRENLVVLWALRGRRAVILALTVENLRLVSALKRTMDREGWRVYAQTQLRSNTIAVYVRQRYRGARPARRR